MSLQSPIDRPSSELPQAPDPDWYPVFFEQISQATRDAFAGAVARVSLFGAAADDLDRLMAEDPFVMWAVDGPLFVEAMVCCAEGVAMRVAEASRGSFDALRLIQLANLGPQAVVGEIFHREMTDRLVELAAVVRGLCRRAVECDLASIGLLPDLMLADYIGQLGPLGQDASQRLVERTQRADPRLPVQERLAWSWATWVDTLERSDFGIVFLLGQVVAHDQIKPRVAVAASKLVPAIPAPCVRALVDAGGARTAEIQPATPCERGTEIAVGDSQLFLPHDFVLAMTTAGTAGGHVPNPLAILGTVDAQRVAAWIATQACHRWALGEDDWRRVGVVGGWQGLAKAVGGTVDSRKQLESCLAALQAVRLKLPDGTQIAGLASYTSRPPAPNRPAEIAIVVGDMLAPDLKRRRRDSAALPLPRAFTRLVPVLDPLPGVSCLPSRSRGKGLLLHWLVMTEFTMQRDNLAENGSIRLTARGVETMGRRVGLSAQQVADLFAVWSEPDGAGFGFLHQVGPGRWTLAANHAKALGFLVEGGRRTLVAQKGARKANARKRRSTPKRRSRSS